MASLGPSLPKDVVIDTEAFQQADFIERAVGNVRRALIEGAVMVTVVMFLFLWNFRTTFISLTAIPLSLLAAILTMNYFGISINTMTLGGLAIAIGELVDDAIVDVENVFRRLKQNALAAKPLGVPQVVFRASSEIRNSIFYATFIIILVFLPLFSLAGFEGRMFAPLAFAYIISITASLVVALTVTPVLCYFLLTRSQLMKSQGDSYLVSWMKILYRRTLGWTLDHPSEIIGLSALLLFAAVSLLPLTGREFLPPFNEGALNVNVNLPPGTSLAESNRIGNVVERALHQIPEVVRTTRRTGRAELDEHAAGVNTSELEIVTRPGIVVSSKSWMKSAAPWRRYRVRWPKSDNLSLTASITSCRVLAHRSRSRFSDRTCRRCATRLKRSGRRWRASPASSICWSNHR